MGNYRRAIYLSIVLIIIVIGLLSCEHFLSPSERDGGFLSKPIDQDLLALENTFKDFAQILPEALHDPEICFILWDEANANKEDEPYALWNSIADTPSPSGKSLRKAFHKITLDSVLTNKFDLIEGLQIYIHNFETWDSTLTIPATFTPITVNDIDVRELILFDESGDSTILDVDSTKAIPAYPIAIVGVNESLNYEGEIPKGLGKPATGETLRIKKIKLKRSAWDYEPWFFGKAEVYFRVYDTEYDADEWATVNWEWKLGSYAPLGSYKSYSCWKWNSTWWGGYYSQDKPWRTFNLDTDWESEPDVLFDQSRTYTLRVMEYDWPFYDGGVTNWCAAVTSAITFGSYFAFGPEVAGILGLLTWLVCDLVIVNDDFIGSKTSFEDIVFQANNDQAHEHTWVDNEFELKVRAE